MSPTGGHARQRASEPTLLLIPCHEAFHTQGGGEMTNEAAPAYHGTIMISTRGAFYRQPQTAAHNPDWIP